MTLKDTDYMYSSARVRAASGSFTAKERLDKMLEVRDIPELNSLISTMYGNLSGDQTQNGGAAILDSVIDDIVEDVINLVLISVPVPEILHFLLYQYDCINIKTAIKYLMRGIQDISPDMLYTYGTVSRDLISEAVNTRDFSPLPQNMASAAASAIDEYIKTKDPRIIDFKLDRACFADIISGAEKCCSPILLEMMREKIDYINIQIYLRIIKTFVGMGGTIFENSLLSGGFLDEVFSAYIQNFENADFDTFYDMLKTTRYKILTEKFTASSSFSKIEKECDDLWLSNLGRFKYQAFGIEVIASHIITAEYEAKNLRIIKAGLTSGQSPEKIREKVRAGHV